MWQKSCKKYYLTRFPFEHFYHPIYQSNIHQAKRIRVGVILINSKVTKKPSMTGKNVLKFTCQIVSLFDPSGKALYFL